MKFLTALMIAGLAIAPGMYAQAPAASGPPPAASVGNPVVWSAQQIYDRQSKFLVAAAEQMPADKYSYHPTPAQWSYAKIVSHVAQANGAVCAMLSDTTAPAAAKVKETAPKDELLAALKASVDFCGPVMANLKDAKLGDTVTYFGGARVPRARALIEIVADLEDHYSQMASYLRLNGMTPPSAAPKK